jgi:hypothetical protein
MTGAVLYIAVTCDNVSAAQGMLRNFINAGLNTDSSAVHVAIGDPDTLTKGTHDES